jgi:hypothetical protein
MAKQKTDLDRLMADTQDLPSTERALLVNRLITRGVVTSSDVAQARKRSPRS